MVCRLIINNDLACFAYEVEQLQLHLSRNPDAKVVVCNDATPILGRDFNQASVAFCGVGGSYTITGRDGNGVVFHWRARVLPPCNMHCCVNDTFTPAPASCPDRVWAEPCVNWPPVVKVQSRVVVDPASGANYYELLGEDCIQ